MKKLRKCASCGAYTLKNVHCEKPTSTAHPPKYSPLDKWAEWRRRAKALGSKVE